QLGDLVHEVAIDEIGRPVAADDQFDAVPARLFVAIVADEAPVDVRLLALGHLHAAARIRPEARGIRMYPRGRLGMDQPRIAGVALLDLALDGHRPDDVGQLYVI